PLASGASPGDDGLLDDVDDTADHQADVSVRYGVNDDLHGGAVPAVGGRRLAAVPEYLGDVDQGQDFVAILDDLVATHGLQGGAGELFEARDQGEGDADAAAVTRRADEHGLAVAGDDPGGAGRRNHAALAHLRDDVGPLRQPEHVEDEGHLAVAHDGRAGED